MMTSVLVKLNKLLDKKQKKKIVILFIINLFGAFLEALGVSLMVPFITAVMNPDIINSNSIIIEICKKLDINSHRTFAVFCIILIVAVFIFKNLFLVFQYYLQARFVYNNRFLTQQRIFKAFLNKRYEFFLSAKSGDMMRVIQANVKETYDLLTTLLGAATEIIVSAVLVATIFIINPLMTIFVAVTLAVIVTVISRLIRPLLSRKGSEFQYISAKMNNWIIQAIIGIKEVKVSGKESFFEDVFREDGNKAINSEKIYFVLNNIPRMLIEMFSVCSMLSLIALTIYNGQDMEKLLPTLAAFAMAAVKLMPSSNRIISAFNAIAFQEAALDSLLKDINELGNGGSENVLEESGVLKNRVLLNKCFELKNITYRYPENTENILENADMIIPVGSSVGIIGKSGAGKTTTVDILLGLLKPQSGQILSDGDDVLKNYKQWLSNLGYIPQSIFMMDDSIRANVAFGVRDKDINDEDVWNVLKEAQMFEFVKGLPEGINTQIGERGVRLSGGQRQRLGIARALYVKPKILVFDEATSALDIETEAEIMSAINNLHGKITMIIIAHRLQTIEGCDIIYSVEDKKIVRKR